MLALFAIFALLAIPLKSYTQPLIVMSVLPFAFVGAVWGHVVMKPVSDITGLSAPSMFGVIAACGVVVNATLVLLHSVNAHRAAGDSLHDALVKATVGRCRPIVITTVTTFVGVAPLMLSRNVQALPMIPMAVSLAYGVLFAGVAALLAVPAFWLALHRLSRGAKRVGGDLVDTAPRLSKWMARFPYVGESLRSREFTDLQIDDISLDAQEAATARRGLVRLYYAREFDRAEMRGQLAVLAAKSPQVDDLAREARIWAEQRTFQLGVHMLRDAIAPADAARPMSDILNACLGTLMIAAKAEFASKHEAIPGSRTALVALGAAGRRELATGRPFEMLFLYDHDPVPASLGLDPARWHGQFLRRLQRLAEELSAGGMLFEPSAPYVPGDAGPCSFARFKEHIQGNPPLADLRMLVHASVIEGEGDLGSEFEAFRRTVLTAHRDTRAVVAAIAAERTRRVRDPWDVVHRSGGLADLERTVEAIQLGAGARTPEVLVNGIVPTFEAASRHALLGDDLAQRLIHAAVLWQNLDGFMRMSSPGAFSAAAFDTATLPPEQRDLLAGIGAVADIRELPELIARTAEDTAEIVTGLLAGSLFEFA